ncbi:uncharacterized protein METZ01_LOCUS254029 [marine metagenome]|uniref:Uncharacterized protein n=1 Tax=marine metagenome TaxID=408172 RepID=A0A382IP75_9ZZZZ
MNGLLMRQMDQQAVVNVIFVGRLGNLVIM